MPWFVRESAMQRKVVAWEVRNREPCHGLCENLFSKESSNHGTAWEIFY